MVKPKKPFIRGRSGACSKHLSSLLPANSIKVEEKNQFQKVILEPLYACSGMYVFTYTYQDHTYSNNDKLKKSVPRGWEENSISKVLAL